MARFRAPGRSIGITVRFQSEQVSAIIGIRTYAPSGEGGSPRRVLSITPNDGGGCGRCCLVERFASQEVYRRRISSISDANIQRIGRVYSRPAFAPQGLRPIGRVYVAYRTREFRGLNLNRAVHFSLLWRKRYSQRFTERLRWLPRRLGGLSAAISYLPASSPEGSATAGANSRPGGAGED
jgi:hypothetical protein